MAPILLQFASQGITVFANGPATPKTFEQTINRNLMADAIDWAEKAKKTPEWSHLDTSRIATGGQSCGGFESLVMAYDKRVTTIGVFNSGFRTGMSTGTIGLPLPNKGKIPSGSEIKVPLFMFMGGKGDVSTASVRLIPVSIFLYTLTVLFSRLLHSL
jgi:dienelactone hydrolase